MPTVPTTPPSRPAPAPTAGYPPRPAAAPVAGYPPRPAAAGAGGLAFATAQPYAVPRTSGRAVAAMVLGIVGCTLWWIPIVGWGMIVVDILAVVLGATAMKEVNASQGRVTGKGMAVAGLVLGIVGLAFWLVIVLIIGLFVAAVASAGAA